MAGKSSRKKELASTDDSFLFAAGKCLTRLAQTVIGTALFAAQIAAYEFSGLLMDEKRSILTQIRTLLGGASNDLHTLFKRQILLDRLQRLIQVPEHCLVGIGQKSSKTCLNPFKRKLKFF